MIDKGLRIDQVKDRQIRILVVDDEDFNLEIISEVLDDSGYQVDVARNGLEACRLLNANPDKYHTILLDWMMPEMDGLEVMRYIKAHPRFRDIPVVMQTAKATTCDVQKGLDAGVLFYLRKPFSRDNLLAIVDTAACGYFKNLALRNAVGAGNAELEQGYLEFSTLVEARSVASLLANACPDPARVVVGLSELLINAVEHGNLGIEYAEKTRLLAANQWIDEVERRLSLPENQAKRVRVSFEEYGSEIRIWIQDEGDGFNSDAFMTLDLKRAENSHGRGIAIARMVSFDALNYQGNGSEVVAVIKNKVSCN